MSVPNISDHFNWLLEIGLLDTALITFSNSVDRSVITIRLLALFKIFLKIRYGDGYG